MVATRVVLDGCKLQCILCTVKYGNDKRLSVCCICVGITVHVSLQHTIHRYTLHAVHVSSFSLKIRGRFESTFSRPIIMSICFVNVGVSMFCDCPHKRSNIASPKLYDDRLTVLLYCADGDVDASKSCRKII